MLVITAIVPSPDKRGHRWPNPGSAEREVVGDCGDWPQSPQVTWPKNCSACARAEDFTFAPQLTDERKGSLSPAVWSNKGQRRVSNAEQSQSSSLCPYVQEWAATAPVHRSCSNVSTTALFSLTNPTEDQDFLVRAPSHSLQLANFWNKVDLKGLSSDFQAEFNMWLVSECPQTYWDVWCISTTGALQERNLFWRSAWWCMWWCFFPP